MRVHFTFNEGNSVQHDGTKDFKTLDAAKREAMLALAQSLQEDVRRSGEIMGSVAGIGENGEPLFSVTIHVTIA